MRAYVGITDSDWYNLLRNQPSLDEVNFWRPKDLREFKAIDPGELFLFKLHSPDNYIVGGGIYAHFASLPISLAWESFGISNGANSLYQMRTRVTKYRDTQADHRIDFKIGCILLEQPFFLPHGKWISVPGWNAATQQGRTYDMTIEPGRSIWLQLQSWQQLATMAQEDPPRYGQSILSMPRLGQGTFRVMVTEAYNWRCSITKERTLPALDAAHIKPYSESGMHTVNNGVLLRRDLHALFDKGYVTITPSFKLEVSRRIREEYENGKDYYGFHGTIMTLPTKYTDYPSSEYLDWHNINVYRG
jgi:putative restriction endonuclease